MCAVAANLKRINIDNLPKYFSSAMIKTRLGVSSDILNRRTLSTVRQIVGLPPVIYKEGDRRQGDPADSSEYRNRKPQQDQPYSPISLFQICQSCEIPIPEDVSLDFADAGRFLALLLPETAHNYISSLDRQAQTEVTAELLSSQSKQTLRVRGYLDLLGAEKLIELVQDCFSQGREETGKKIWEAAFPAISSYEPGFLWKQYLAKYNRTIELTLPLLLSRPYETFPVFEALFLSFEMVPMIESLSAAEAEALFISAYKYYSNPPSAANMKYLSIFTAFSSAKIFGASQFQSVCGQLKQEPDKVIEFVLSDSCREKAYRAWNIAPPANSTAVAPAQSKKSNMIVIKTTPPKELVLTVEGRKLNIVWKKDKPYTVTLAITPLGISKNLYGNMLDSVDLSGAKKGDYTLKVKGDGINIVVYFTVE